MVFQIVSCSPLKKLNHRFTYRKFSTRLAESNLLLNLNFLYGKTRALLKKKMTGCFGIPHLVSNQIRVYSKFHPNQLIRTFDHSFNIGFLNNFDGHFVTPYLINLLVDVP